MALGFEPRALLLLGSALHLSYTCHSVLFSYKVFCLDREKLGFPFWGMGKGNTSLISSYVKLKKKSILACWGFNIFYTQFILEKHYGGNIL